MPVFVVLLRIRYYNIHWKKIDWQKVCLVWMTYYIMFVKLQENTMHAVLQKIHYDFVKHVLYTKKKQLLMCLNV